MSWSKLQSRSESLKLVRLVVAQSSRWSFSSLATWLQPSTAQVGSRHCMADTWAAVKLRPRCATPTTSVPLVAMATRNGLPLSIMSLIVATGTGP